MAVDSLDLARGIGARFCEEAIWHDDRATWLGDDKVRIGEDWEVVHRSLDGDLYGGTAGIALFLARLWSLTGDDSLREAAEGAIQHAIRWAKHSAHDASLYSGLAGVAAVAAELADLLTDDSLEAEARDLARRTADHPRMVETDLISGESGRLIALLELARRFEMPSCMDAARDLGQAILERAASGPYPGLSWPDGSGGPPLCGLGHGGSGIALALAELWLAGGNDQFLDASLRAAEYERAWYQREVLNWPDLREVSRAKLARSDGASFPNFWCHGAAGIGLVRLRQFELTGERLLAAEAEATLERAERDLALLLNGGVSVDLSLCHGLAALTELFVSASQTFEEPEYLSRAADCASIAGAIGGDGAGPWPSGVPDGGENPSLMLGYAGTGMMFLRVAAPTSKPVGLLFTEPHMHERVIVQLNESVPPDRFGQAAKDLTAMFDGVRVERISRRGRILLRLPPRLGVDDVLGPLRALDQVAYAEADQVDRPADSLEGSESS